MTESILDEIRRYRDEHAAKFNYDLEAIYQDLKRREEESKRNGWVFIPAPDLPTKEPTPQVDDTKSRQAAA